MIDLFCILFVLIAFSLIAYTYFKDKNWCCKQDKLDPCDDACDSCDTNKPETIMMGGEEEDKT